MPLLVGAFGRFFSSLTCHEPVFYRLNSFGRHTTVIATQLEPSVEFFVHSECQLVTDHPNYDGRFQ